MQQMKEKTSTRRIRFPNPRHLKIRDDETLTAGFQKEGTKMTKLSTITAAFVLFAPIAYAILTQAAQIVA